MNWSSTNKSSVVNIYTMNYPKKTSFNLYQSRHCAYITYSVKTWFLKILSVGGGGIDMNWLDGMTGCGGECNLASSSVTFSDFAIW